MQRQLANFPSVSLLARHLSMPHRQFKDAKQINWEVWDVHPGDVELRLRSEREPQRSQRSLATEKPRAAVARDLAKGWLCFESLEVKRRLWPIPDGWERLNDAELSRLCSQAKDAPAR